MEKFKYAPQLVYYMTLNQSIIEIENNKYIDGVIGKEIFFGEETDQVPLCHYPITRTVPAGEQHKVVSLNVWDVDVRDYLVKNSKYYQRSGKMKRWAIRNFDYGIKQPFDATLRNEVYKSLKRSIKRGRTDAFYFEYLIPINALRDEIYKTLSSGNIEVDRSIEIETVRLIDIDYNVTLNILSEGPIRDLFVYVGSYINEEVSAPMGIGCGGESSTVISRSDAYSKIHGTEYGFRLKIKNKN